MYNGGSENVGGNHSLVKHRVSVLSTSREMTHALGVGLGRVLLAGDIVCLQGELGAGKTHLAKGIAAGLGVSECVTSPTFIIVNEYSVPRERFKMYHIDLYRVESLAEAVATGLDEYWSGGDICVVEWAERARRLLPGDRLWVNLEYRDSVSRQLTLEASGRRSTELLDRFKPALQQVLTGEADRNRVSR